MTLGIGLLFVGVYLAGSWLLGTPFFPNGGRRVNLLAGLFLAVAGLLWLADDWFLRQRRIGAARR